MKSGLIALALLTIAAPALAAEPVEMARTEARPILIESVAFDTRGHLLVSSVHDGGVWRLDGGRLTRFSPADAVKGGVFGLVANPGRGDLWAVATHTPYDNFPDSPAGSQVLRLDLASGAVKAAYAAPSPENALGDIALGPDGAVYVSDTHTREVLRLDPASGRFERVVQLAERGSPQGLVVSDTGNLMVFNDYAYGLQRVVLANGTLQPIAAPEGVNLRGLDGLVRDGNRLIAVQNGLATPKVLAITLSPDWTRIERVEVLAEGGALSEPTTGIMAGGGYVFVSRSQWTAFGRDGAPTEQTPPPAVVSRLALR